MIEAAGGRPVTFRTLDIGGDKVLPYMRTAEEENPAMGWRAIRLGLDRPGLLRMQIRALLHAAAERELRVMLPMVTELDEVRRARDLIQRELGHMRRHGHAEPRELKIGAMIEVPAMLFQLDGLAKVADFISVGSNDLLQFMTASDRGNMRVAEPFRPAVAPVPACAARHFPGGGGGPRAGDPLRRARREPARRDGARRPRLSLPVDVGGRDRPGQGDDPRPRRRRTAEDLNALLDDGETVDGLRAALARFAETHGVPI